MTRLRPYLPLAIVAVGYIAVQLLRWPIGVPLSWDEALYVSQVSPAVPDLPFGPSRARGITWLAAPVAYFTPEPGPIQIWMIALSGLALFLAFAPWLRVVRPMVVAFAAVLFAGLWLTQIYGPQVMPNLYVAFGAVATAGLFVLAVTRGSRPAYAGLAVAVAVTTLVRPTDAAWLVAPLFLAAIAVPAWRRIPPIAALAAGAAVGLIPWLIEAQVRYGGPVARLSAADEAVAGLRPGRGFLYQLRVLDGPLHCEAPCNKIPLDRPLLAVWAMLLPLLVTGGLVVAQRAGRLAPMAVAAGCALGVATPYLFLISWGSPRFLLPAYALAALPAVEFLAWLVSLRPRLVAAGGVAVLLALHLASQQLVLTELVKVSERRRHTYGETAQALRSLGVTSPCRLTGYQGEILPEVAYQVGCAMRSIPKDADKERWASFIAKSRSTRTAWVVRDKAIPPELADWRRHTFPRTDGGQVTILMPG